MKKLLLIIPVAFLMAGCATIKSGSDPIVVRAEQSEQVAFATFDTFLKIDNANRQFFRTSLPAVHQFAEWLRTPIGNPPSQRGIAMIESFDKVKVAYKSNRTPDNKANLITALATLEAAIAETQKQLNATTGE
jgi:hypothetical protein